MAFDRREARTKRHQRVRKIVAGTADKPRLCVFRSNLHIYAQIVDDAQGHTVAAAGTVEGPLREQLKGNGGTVEAAKAVGALVAQRAKEKGIEFRPGSPTRPVASAANRRDRGRKQLDT